MRLLNSPASGKGSVQHRVGYKQVIYGKHLGEVRRGNASPATRAAIDTMRRRKQRARFAGSQVDAASAKNDAVWVLVSHRTKSDRSPWAIRSMGERGLKPHIPMSYELPGSN